MLNKFFLPFKLRLGLNVSEHSLVLFIPNREVAPWDFGIWQLNRYFALHDHVELLSNVLVVEQNVTNLEFLLSESPLEVISVTFFEYTREEWNRFINVRDAILASVRD